MRKRRKQLLDVLNERREYWKLEEEALDRTVWRTGFGRGCGPVVRLAREWMNMGFICQKCCHNDSRMWNKSTSIDYNASLRVRCLAKFVNEINVTCNTTVCWLDETGYLSNMLRTKIRHLQAPNNFKTTWGRQLYLKVVQRRQLA